MSTNVTIPANVAAWHRIARLLGGWAAVLYPVISSIQSTSWGGKDTVLSLIGGAILYAEHNNATPNVTTVADPTRSNLP